MKEYYKYNINKVMILKEGESLWTLKTINKDGTEDVHEILPYLAKTTLMLDGGWKEKVLD